MTAQKGAVLIIVLILLMVLFVMGMTILGIKSTQAKSAMMMQQATVAKYIAEAGMEDAKIKLQKDIDFPPIDGKNTCVYAYSENLTYPGDNAPVGEYKVTIDVSRCNSSNANYDLTILITSLGIVKDTYGNRVACHQITGLLDASLLDRTDGTSTNPFIYQYIDWRDHGNI